MTSQQNGDVIERVFRMEGAIGEIRGAISEIRDAVKVIAPAIVQLATLESKHAQTREAMGRAFEEIAEVEGRVTVLEMDMPVLKLTSSWVQRAALGTLAVVGLALLAVVIVKW